MTRVTSNGVDLAVWEHGDPARPTVVLVHGYPDTHVVWNDVVAALAEEFHVVTFDNRGAGASGSPRGLAPYRIEQLADDVRAVLDAVSPGEPVHLVGHDWGSILSWELVTEPSAVHRIATYTSIAGPCLDHIGHWLRRPGDARALARQLLRSWYVAAFQVPGLGALPWRLGLGTRWDALLERVDGLPRRADQHVTTRADDGAAGVALYRANVPRRFARPGSRPTTVPVQVVHLTRDRFVGPDLTSGLERWVPRLRRTSVDASHWAPLTHGPELAGLIADHARNPVGVAQ